jgi:hypothetical protein
VNSNIVVSFHHTVAVKRCLEDDEIERQLKCKIRDVRLCILGCFEKYHKKAAIQLDDGQGSEAYICIEKITIKGVYI